MKAKETLVVELNDFIKAIQQIAKAFGSKKYREISLTNHSESWTDSLGNEHVISVIWVTYPKHPLLNKPDELKEYTGEVIITHKIAKGIPGVFTEYQVLQKKVIGIETEELGKKIKVLYVR